ncbi:hypothetical protein JB92DRAFT_3100008 [Gautieria morchelliformis]|nr:hypothetical protein JB92DRAFT_3100008 [Gautieria morchelliformis]
MNGSGGCSWKCTWSQDTQETVPWIGLSIMQDPVAVLKLMGAWNERGGMPGASHNHNAVKAARPARLMRRKKGSGNLFGKELETDSEDTVNSLNWTQQSKVLATYTVVNRGNTPLESNNNIKLIVIVKSVLSRATPSITLLANPPAPEYLLFSQTHTTAHEHLVADHKRRRQPGISQAQSPGDTITSRYIPPLVSSREEAGMVKEKETKRRDLARAQWCKRPRRYKAPLARKTELLYHSGRLYWLVSSGDLLFAYSYSLVIVPLIKGTEHCRKRRHLKIR